MNDFNIYKNIVKINKKYEIDENVVSNESFCMAPWIHLNVSPNGDVPICCNILNTKETVAGNINEKTLDEIWNSDEIKKIRIRMLKGEKISECSSCYKREKISRYSSMRNAFNDKYYNKHKNIVKETFIDGYVKKRNIVYFDFRFSNKCNFSCRTCGPHYSSSWEKKLNLETKKINDISSLIKKTEEMIVSNELEEIYFAGGEPLINNQHWEIIDILTKYEKFDIEIRYNTNLSVLRYKENFFIEKLKPFKNVLVSPSCDSLGIRGEYIRTGFITKNFIKNIKELEKNSFKYNITTVLSFFNIMYLYEFITDLKKNNINYNNLHFIIVTDSDIYDIYNLPIKVLDKSIEGIDKLLNENFLSDEKKNYFNILKKSLQDNCHFNKKIFDYRMDYIKKQDSINKLKFENCFPELKSLIEQS